MRAHTNLWTRRKQALRDNHPHRADQMPAMLPCCAGLPIHAAPASNIFVNAEKTLSAAVWLYVSASPHPIIPRTLVGKHCPGVYQHLVCILIFSNVFNCYLLISSEFIPLNLL